MSRFEIFLVEPLEIGSILEGLGWQLARAGENPYEIYGVDEFRLEGQNWRAFVWGPSRMTSEDAPPQAVALLPGIAWHVEVSLDGSKAGLQTVMRAVRAVATAGHGVIADDRHVWRPGSSRRTRWSMPPSPLESETEWLTMIWWTLDSSLTTLTGATAFVHAVQRVLPEALPVRWGDFEPFSFNLEHEGLDGLARWIQRKVDDSFLSQVRPPFAEFSVHRAALVGGRPSLFDPIALSIAGGGSILSEDSGGRQMALAFREISRLLRPFYAEARHGPNQNNVEWHTATTSSVGPPPVNARLWNGYPRVAPMAMVVGPPYLAFWQDGAGEALDQLVLYSSDSWPDPPSGGVPVAVEDLLQEFDPYSVVTADSARGEYPTRPPAIWPFENYIS